MATNEPVGNAGLTGFERDVEKARREGDVPLLLLLAEEATRYGGPWATEGASLALATLIELGSPWLAWEAGKRAHAEGLAVPHGRPDASNALVREPRAIAFLSPPVVPAEGATRPFAASAPPAIREALERELDALRCDDPTPCVGYAGVASACEVLFHEVCAARGIETTALLPVAPKAHRETFKTAADGSEEWTRRHDAILRDRRTRVFGPDLTAPPFVPRDVDYPPWERITLWMLFHALAHGAENTTLLVFAEDVAGVDGADIVKLARASGAHVAVIDAAGALAAAASGPAG